MPSSAAMWRWDRSPSVSTELSRPSTMRSFSVSSCGDARRDMDTLEDCTEAPAPYRKEPEGDPSPKTPSRRRESYRVHIVNVKAIVHPVNNVIVLINQRYF